MMVSVRLFAGLRERAGSQRVEVELPEGALVSDLLAAMETTPVGALAPGQCVVAVNREYAPATAPLREDDEVALVPPLCRNHLNEHFPKPNSMDWYTTPPHSHPLMCGTLELTSHLHRRNSPMKLLK